MQQKSGKKLSHWMACTHSLLISMQNGFSRKKNARALNTKELCSMRKKPSHDRLGLHKVLTYLL